MNDLYPIRSYPTGLYKLFRQEAGGMMPMTLPMNAPGPLGPGAGFSDIFQEERLVFADARKLQSFYPRTAQEIQRHVEEECDRMEYEGSMMFDEYPDRLMIQRLADRIREQMENLPGEEALGMEDFSGEETSQMESLPEEEALSMQSGRRRPPSGREGLGDLIQVMLLDEMHRRRCRHRRCRSRRFW